MRRAYGVLRHAHLILSIAFYAIRYTLNAIRTYLYVLDAKIISSYNTAMSILSDFREKRLKAKRANTINLLRKIDPSFLLRLSQKNVLIAFKRAAKRTPAYRKLLTELNINPAKINSIEAFAKFAPYLDKKTTFQDNPILDVCLDGNLNEVKSLLTSSGHSGIFSFGVNTYRNLRDSSYSIDLGLDYSFNISKKKTLLINCLPMGVKVNTSLTLAETSTREDMVWAVIKKFSPLFEQTILVGEGSFLKKIIEDGALQGIEWKKGVFHLVTGEEGIAENYRNYIGSLLGTDFNDPSRGMIGSSMGVAELDLNIFHETKDTINIRRAASKDKKLKEALFGKAINACPMFFVYYPHRTYIEELLDLEGNSQIIISMLSKRMKIPLIRYKTGDMGKILTFGKVKSILRENGHHNLVPELKLPMIAIYGRGANIKINNIALYPEEIKEALYSDFHIASCITGAFKLVNNDHIIRLHIQLKKGIGPSDEIKEKIYSLTRLYTTVPLEVTPYSYQSFPYFMELDYERKFNYI